MRPERPNLLGLVCWVLILGNLADIYLKMKKMGDPTFADSLAIYPYSPLIAEIIMFGTMAVSIISAICMYEGQGWARYIYFANMVPYFVQHYLAVSSAKNPQIEMYILDGKFALFAASAVILYLPKVRRYFHPPRYLDE
jgi:hypothetical protein